MSVWPDKPIAILSPTVGNDEMKNQSFLYYQFTIGLYSDFNVEKSSLFEFAPLYMAIIPIKSAYVDSISDEKISAAAELIRHFFAISSFIHAILIEFNLVPKSV